MGAFSNKEDRIDLLTLTSDKTAAPLTASTLRFSVRRCDVMTPSLPQEHPLRTFCTAASTMNALRFASRLAPRARALGRAPLSTTSNRLGE